MGKVNPCMRGLIAYIWVDFTHQPMYAINPLIIHIVLMIVIMHVEVK